MSHIKAEVRRYIEDNLLLGAGAVSPGDGESFLEHQVLDSTGFLELVAHLEASYGIQIGDDEMVPENLDTLDAIEAFVQRKREAA